MKKIIFATIFAGLCAVGANAACDVTYSIGTKAQLDEFRDVVNGLNGKTKNTAACAVLTADIVYNSQVHETADGANLTLYKSQTAVSGKVEYNEWTPIVGFAGSFDGNGKTIVGLYMSTTSDAGFFKSVYGGAVIKNLNIADSYFRVESERAAGLIVKVESNAVYNNKLVIVDNCTVGASYNGRIRGTVVGGTHNTLSSDVGGVNIGGLVGIVSTGTRITISNSINNSRVLSAYQDRAGWSYVVTEETLKGTNIGGLIAYVESGAVANVVNCYNTGKVDDNKGDSLSATVATASGTVEKDNVACLSGVSGCATADAKSSSELTTAFSNYTQSNLFSYYDAATVESIIGSGSHPGVTFSDDGLTLIATFTDVATTFSIPQDIKVDKVVFNRKFTNNKSSTIALPFNVTDLGTVSGATFYSLAGISPRDQSDEQSRDTINAEAVTSVEAYKPYLVQPGAENGTLSVSGAVTLKKSEGAALTHTFAGDDWTFTAVLEKKKWAEGGDNANELGKVYGFAGAESGSYHAGNFVLIGKAYIMPMRAYLIYNKDLPECGKALCKPSAVELPEEFVVRYSAPKAESVVEEVSSIEGSDETPSVEGFDEPTTGVVRTISIPATVKDPRWFDFKGRSVSHKPKTHGAFVKNNTPIVVK